MLGLILLGCFMGPPSTRGRFFCAFGCALMKIRCVSFRVGQINPRANLYCGGQMGDKIV